MTTKLRFAAVLFGVLLAAAPVAAHADTPDIFDTFTPAATVAGLWDERPGGDLAVVDTGVGVCDPAGARAWLRPDGTEFALHWWTCPPAAARELADEVAATRIRMGRTPGAASYLGSADAVFPARGATVRTWVQGPYSIQLVVGCPAGGFAGCAPLSGEAARQIAAALPGEPVTTGLQPPPGKVVSAVATLWVFVVGIPMLVQGFRRLRFDAGGSDPRWTSVDATAREIRWRYRGRRAGIVIGVLSLLPLLGAVLNPQDGWLTGIARFTGFVVLLGAAAALFVRCRHPMLGATIPARRRFRVARPSVRRVLGAAAVTVPAVVLLSAPFVALLALVMLQLIVRGGTGDMTESDAWMLFAVATVAVVALGFLVDRLGRRLWARNADEAISADERPPVLYLRNFGDDTLRIPASALGRVGPWQHMTGWLNPSRTHRFEEILTRALARFGPVIAVAQPGTRLPRLGAAKTFLPHDNWLEQVTKRANEALAVVVSAAPHEVRPGLSDELRMLAEALPHGRIVLVVGPHRSKPRLYDAIERFLYAVDPYPMFRTLTKKPIADGALVLVHTPRYGWGHWYGWSGSRRTAWTYTAAINEAMSTATAEWR